MKKTLFIVGIICILAITASLVYYLAYYVPHRDDQETGADIEAETESFCACLIKRTNELAQSEDNIERCQTGYPDDTEGYMECMDAGRFIAAYQADRECLEQYPRTTKRVKTEDSHIVKCETPQ